MNLGEIVRQVRRPGGDTLDRNGKPFMGTGYAVADPLLTNRDNPDEVLTWLMLPEVREALAKGRYIGKWTNPETQATELTVTDVMQDGVMALDLAESRHQADVGYIENGRYIGDIPT